MGFINGEAVNPTGGAGALLHPGQLEQSLFQPGQDLAPGIGQGQISRGRRDGADYLGVGAVFSTSTKADAMPVSYETLQAICRAVSIPVVAIGGIQRENLLSLTGSGVDGVALVSAIFAAPDVETASRELRALSEAMVRA